MGMSMQNKALYWRRVAAELSSSLEEIAQGLNKVIVNQFGDDYEWAAGSEKQIDDTAEPNWSEVQSCCEAANSALHGIDERVYILSLEQVKEETDSLEPDKDDCIAADLFFTGGQDDAE